MKRRTRAQSAFSRMKGLAAAAVDRQSDIVNELKKLGLRIRPRIVESRSKSARAPARQQPGHIAFDDRGNAIYEWSDETLSEDGAAGERARRQALEHPGLSLMEDEPRPGTPIRNNPAGLRKGYDPYESGVLGPKPRTRKRDLRELSKWIENKRKLAARAEDD